MLVKYYLYDISKKNYLYDKLKASNIRVQCDWGIRLDYFLASSIHPSATIGDNT
jgi:hypothetical protein